MDSPPEPANASTATASGGSKPSSSGAATLDSPPVQESPFSNYVRGLSPIKSVKVSNAAQQGFLGINSPPLVFTSPHLHPRETSFLQRSYCPQILREQVCEDEDQSKEFVDGSCNVDKPSSSIRSPLFTDTDKDAKTPGHDPLSSSSGCIDQYLSEPLEVECENSVNSASAKRKQVNDALQLSIINSSDRQEVVSEANEVLEIGNAVKLQMLEQQTSCKKDKEEPQGHLISGTEQEKVQKEQSDNQLSSECPCAEGDTLYHATNKEDSRMAGAQVMRVISAGPAESVMQHDPEASHLHRSLSRRCLQFEAVLLPPCLVKTPSAVSRPSGIGLHLNSIASTLPLGHKATATIKGGLGWDNQIIGKEDISSSSPSMVESASVTTGERAVKDEAKVLERFGEIEALNVLQSLEATPLNKRKPNLDFTNSSEGHNQANPKKKWKKSSTSDSDGCKRCNCKKTKCLKLYCDCFAAGIYCADSCSCQGCFNRPEYEDIVLETRQQIESRNPFAFAPKIVQAVTESPATIGDDKSLVATSLVRHKKGCNCKKSVCLKKYCECYQANVGCSNECRCEGCQNHFGKKGDYGMTEDMISLRTRDGTLQSSGDEKLDLVATEKGLLHLDLYDQHSMTPLTPLLQFSDHGKDPSKSRLDLFVSSPESSDPSMLPPCPKTLKYPSNAYSNDVVQETNKDLVSYSSDQLMHHDMQLINQHSPRSEEIASICDFRPSQNPSLPSASLKTRSWIPPCPGSGRLLPTGSLLRQTSPMTPMAPLTEAKSHVLDSGSELHNIMDDDDTPDILKESTPSTAVKVTSPNKKRVTPPNGNLGELGSSSSVGLKCSRKFILKAVPSFPPLTPCMDSKSSTQQKHQ